MSCWPKRTSPTNSSTNWSKSNPDFPNTDVSIVIGANDVVNPDARDNPASPIAGMPILEVDRSRSVLVLKRGKGKGFSGLENPLFFKENTGMLYGDAKASLAKLVIAVRQA
jgi:NAD(P) transhydrogenase subunit beta